MSDFQDILNTPMDSIERRPAPPEGTYRVRFGKPEFKKVGEKQTPAAEYPVLLIEALDVDDVALKESSFKPGETRSRYTCWLSTAALDAGLPKDFLDALGVRHKGRSLGECLLEAEGMEARALVRHELDKQNPERRYLRIEQVLPA